ncbi:hypothetical protein [Staphylococcus massiliensis]|uniref:Uncharacterized protein n=1 Tax=Staphylococcus massiliensis S46 TaxID=1229783 RepID=K9AUU6_9STAP|nr:hypothetical protein [Staphylococcus massiliensis]EKU49831.1 hypothetical protein C273_03005 [Staphylococcus massiliensis S46]
MGDIKELYDRLMQNLMSLDDDVRLKELKFYNAFKLIKNFVSV